jgi:hypothetical protein
MWVRFFPETHQHHWNINTVASLQQNDPDEEDGSFVKIHRTNKPVLKHKIKLLKKNLLTDISIFDVAEISATATPEVQASTSALTSSRNTGFPNVLCASLGAIK